MPSTLFPRPVLRATGYANKQTAQKVATMVASLRDRGEFDLLDAVVDGKTTLFDVHQAQVQNKLEELKKMLKRVPIEPFIEPWLESCAANGLSKASVNLYRRRMQKLLAPDGEQPVVFADELTEAKILKLIPKLNVTSGTARQYLHELQSFCRHLVAEGVMGHNPAANRDIIKRPKKNKGRRRWVREDVDLAIVDAAEPEYQGVFAFLHGTSADRGDVTRLRRRDVNLNQRYVDLDGNDKSETRRRMGVPVEPWALPYLVRACEGLKPEDLVFAGLSLDAISRAHTHATKKAKVKNYLLRDSRHSYAIRAILRGAAIADVSEWLGHASLATTYETYVHFDGEVKRILKAGSGIREGEDVTSNTSSARKSGRPRRRTSRKPLASKANGSHRSPDTE
ncbi:MAG: tyrosine-type recombinase/integrase [Gemmatimonadota bacterium]|nr:tyrosine-type recombinase/integrase [Gemmatimonadota bacterium]